MKDGIVVEILSLMEEDGCVVCEWKGFLEFVIGMFYNNEYVFIF